MTSTPATFTLRARLRALRSLFSLTIAGGIFGGLQATLLILASLELVESSPGWALALAAIGGSGLAWWPLLGLLVDTSVIIAHRRELEARMERTRRGRTYTRGSRHG